MVKTRLAIAALLALTLCLPAAAADYYFKVNDLKADAHGPAGQHGGDPLRHHLQPASRAATPSTSWTSACQTKTTIWERPGPPWPGRTLTDIRNSEYVKPGVEVHLGGSEIRPGQTGTLEFAIIATQMIYPDSDDSRSASLQFKTTWYDGKYVSGNTERIEIHFNLPPGHHARRGEVPRLRPRRLPAERNVLFRTTASSIIWRWLDQPATVPYAAGASFPRDLVASVYSPPQTSILKALFTVVLRLFRLRLLL